MDTILAELIKKYEQRSEAGIKKYGTTLDRDDLLLRDWLIHLQEELMDASLYATKIINYINQLENNNNENLWIKSKRIFTKTGYSYDRVNSSILNY